MRASNRKNRNIRATSDHPHVVATSIRTLAGLLSYLKSRGLVSEAELASDGELLVQYMRNGDLDLQVRGAAIRAVGDLGITSGRASVEALLGDPANGFDWPYDAQTNNAFGSGFTNQTPLLSWTNGVVILENGNLAQGITNGLVIGSGGKATGTNKLKLTITTSGTKAGLFKGSVVNPATGKAIPINGALLQKQDAGYGSFNGTNQSGSVSLKP